ncbi:MAG: DUF1553 domain-containing protein, partial [Planctomycetales bacterium]|nr:DUF1553 domain-containing protein [Planctomycetales bacterium]
DLARYADSNGLDQNLTHYNAWRYRNYLIDAFNNDKPYDRFIVEQLAGDLLPYENDRQLTEQLVATGFLMVGPKQLSERDKEKLRMDVVDEQIDTTGRVFMGMTLGCARCHDHKFDPIPSRDYYGLAGIFRSTTTVDGIKLGNVFVSGWKVRPLPIEPAHAAALKEHEDSLASIETPLKQAREALKKLGQPSKFPRQVADLPGIVVDDREAEKQGDWKDSTYSPNYVGSGYIHDDRMGKGEKSVTFRPKLTAAGMYEVRISYAGSGGRSTRVPVTITHADGEDRVLVDQSKPASIEGLFHSLGQFRFESPEQAAVVIATDGTDDGYVIVDAVQFLPQGAAAAETPKDEAEPQDEADDAEKQRLAERRKTLEQQIKQLEADLAELKKQAPPPARMAMAAADIDEPTDFVQLIRGNHNRPGDPVPRGFLQVAMRSESDDVAITPHQSGRLELAQWIASADNPLTTRVFANRVWHWLMGEGLVRSVDNFGHLGERPSHPELLDYLAARLVQQDWSVKQLVREVVLSRTYRLASQHDAAAFDVDPENRLRWRYPRRRL